MELKDGGKAEVWLGCAASLRAMLILTACKVEFDSSGSRSLIVYLSDEDERVARPGQWVVAKHGEIIIADSGDPILAPSDECDPAQDGVAIPCQS